jgi:hypothetical protein
MNTIQIKPPIALSDEVKTMAGPSSLERRGNYAACVDAALGLATPLAHRMLAKAETSALRRASTTGDEDERSAQIEAARLLARHQGGVLVAFSAALRREFAAQSSEPDMAKPKNLSFDSLELMAEDQIDETVELVRAQQLVLSAVESELSHLNALISAAQGDQIVRASANPLRPQAWVRALREAVTQCDVAAAVRARWMHHLSEALGPELAAVYRELNHLLKALGVEAAAFAVNAALARDSFVVARRCEPGAAPHALASQPLLNLRDLRRLLVGGMGDPDRSSKGDSRSPASETLDTSMTIPWSFQALQEMKQVDHVLQRIRQRRASANDDVATDRDTAAASSVTAAQALGQEVVKLMVENIIADQRLLPVVQQAVRDLEGALLCLVRGDPRFFHDKKHPARQFLFEITQRSLAWTSMDEPGFAEFFEPLRQAIEALVAMEVENAEPFEFALQSLKEAWNEQEAHHRRRRAKVASVLIRVEKRNLLAAQIADDLRSRSDISNAPIEIKQFIAGPWSQVLAAARLAEAPEGAGQSGYEAIINDLVWTSQPRLTAQNPGRLAMLVPPMLQTLRRGLASIEYPAEATQQLMQYLNDQHRPTQRVPSSSACGTGSAAHAETDTRCDKEQASPEVWLEAKEVRQTGLMERISDSARAWRETLGPDHAEAQPTAHPAAGLRPGMWAEIFIDRAWTRWQLAWASPHSLMFMFTNGAGKYQSMTRNMLDKMIALGALRVMSQSVVDGALDAVAQKALHNSMDISV